MYAYGGGGGGWHGIDSGRLALKTGYVGPTLKYIGVRHQDSIRALEEESRPVCRLDTRVTFDCAKRQERKGGQSLVA